MGLVNCVAFHFQSDLNLKYCDNVLWEVCSLNKLKTIPANYMLLRIVSVDALGFWPMPCSENLRIS